MQLPAELGGFLLAAACGAAWPGAARAQGDLLVAPTRVIVDGAGSKQVVLSNIGERQATYRITLELRRMTPDGDIVDVPLTEASPAEKAALAMVTYAPRRITLQPGQPQAVRINVRPPAELPAGEYRVHMRFAAVPEPAPVAAAADPQAPPSGLSIRLTPIYGITIPLIVRKGPLSAAATINSISVRPEGKGGEMSLAMSRTGQRSLYGEIRVTAPGSREPLVLSRGIAIYAELTDRKLDLPVTAEQLTKLHGPVRVEYRELPENGGKLIAGLDARLP